MIEINKINMDKFSIRDNINKDHIEELKESLRNDGLWNPIIVREVNGGYELIAGEHRLIAAKELGWTEIEAIIKKIDDKEANFLALKTNLFRLNMQPIEEGRVLCRMKEEYGLINKDLGKKIGKSEGWIHSRVSLIIKAHEDVQKAVQDKKITTTAANEIIKSDIDDQPFLLKTIEKENISNPKEIRMIKSELINDTIYTIGYEGCNYDQFLKKLQDNEITHLIDIRYSTKSNFKPEFNGEVLNKALNRDNIKYIYKQEFGVPYNIQKPYKQNKLKTECFKQWYEWHITTNTKLDEFNDSLKQLGKCALMCYEKYPIPKGIQKIMCHRNLLTNLLLNLNTIDSRKKFTKRVDL